MTPLGAPCLLFEDETLVCAVRGTSGAFEKLDVDGTGSSWLYFHVGPSEIRNDDFAKERFEAGDAASFGNYYDIICDPQCTYSMYEVANAAVTLAGPLLDKVQDEFARRTGQRATDGFGTYVCFNPGVKEASRAVIATYLAEKGFDVLGVVDYHEVILAGLQARGVVGPTANVALVTASFGDLRFEYLKCAPDSVKHQSEVLPGKGEDARVQVLAELMVDKVAKKNASQLLNYPDLLQAEIKRFYRQARAGLSQFQDGELRVRVTLSDGATGMPVIDERDVNTPVVPKFRHAADKLRAFIGTALNLPKTDRIVIACKALDTDDFASLLARSAGAGKIFRASGDLSALLLLGLGKLVPSGEPARQVRDPIDNVAVKGASKFRVSDLAAEFGVSSDEVLSMLRAMDVVVRSHLTPLTDEQISRARARWEREKRVRAPMSADTTPSSAPSVPPAPQAPPVPAAAHVAAPAVPPPPSPAASPSRPAMPPLPGGGMVTRPAMPPMPRTGRVPESPPRGQVPSLPPLPGKKSGMSGAADPGVKPGASRQSPLPPTPGPKLPPMPPPLPPKPGPKSPPMPPPPPGKPKKR